MKTTLTALLVLFNLIGLTIALQVTPNSPCASICIDNAGADISDPNTSNTYGSDIVCTNADYTTSAIGQKFQNCVSCLQNSTANTTVENDQAWFLYNVRFAFDSCMFVSANTSQPFSSPCSITPACAPLAGAFEAGLSSPSLDNEYAYCGANNDTFSRSWITSCYECLTEDIEETYLSNMLIAMDAGCIQQPKPGVLLGLQGSVFSTARLNITTPVVAVAPVHKKPLTVAAICGIAAAGVIGLVFIVSCAFACYRKRVSKRNLAYRSSLDSRYGHKTITPPLMGAFGDPRERQREITPLWKRNEEDQSLNMGLIKVPAKVVTSDFIHDRFNPPAYEGYYSTGQQPNPAQAQPQAQVQSQSQTKQNGIPSSQIQNQQPLTTTNLGLTIPNISSNRISNNTQFSFDGETPVSDTTYDNTPVSPIEDSQGFKRTILSPMSYGTNSVISSGDSCPGSLTSSMYIKSPPIPNSGTFPPPPPPPPRTNLSSGPGSSSTQRSQLSPPRSGMGPGLPPLPRRNSILLSSNPPNIVPNTKTNNSTGMPSRNFSRRQTRDLSVNHSGSGGQISGPIVTVGNRFEDEEAELRRRKEERARLYREGLGGISGAGSRRNSGASGEGLW